MTHKTSILSATERHEMDLERQRIMRTAPCVMPDWQRNAARRDREEKRFRAIISLIYAVLFVGIVVTGWVVITDYAVERLNPAPFIVDHMDRIERVTQ